MDTTAPARTTSPPALPYRKRRRPALACEECRHRKIKCDRSTPCGPCSRSQSKTCTYQILSGTPPIVRKLPPRTQLNAIEQNRQQSHEHITSASSYSRTPSAPASTSSSLVQVPSYNGSLTTAEHVQALLNRVQSLEKKLVDATRDGTNGESHDAPGAPPTPLVASVKEHKTKKKSNYEKTRFCGHNHWMNYIKQVRFVAINVAYWTIFDSLLTLPSLTS
jgi:hypothetical protein